MALSGFIRRQREALAMEWEQFAGRQMPAALGLSGGELRDSADELLDAIAADMEAGESDDDREKKSRGELPFSGAHITVCGRRHAETRLSQGFTLDQVVSEYRAMRVRVLRHWVAEEGTAVEDVNGVVRFGESVDQCLSETIAWYGGQMATARELFLGVLGHDLRTPLGAVRTSADLLLRDQALSGRTTKIAVRIATSADRMAQMIDDLLDFTTTRLGNRLPLKTRQVALGPVLKESIEELRAAHPDADLRYDCEGDLTGAWDVGRIGQLLSNLVANAIQHGRPSRPVTVLARGQAEQVIVTVHNEGPPIVKALQGKIFDPLMRGLIKEAEVRSRQSGIGLGLYICREIARAHGGEIGVSSSARRGTRFTVRFPRPSDKRPRRQ